MFLQCMVPIPNGDGTRDLLQATAHHVCDVPERLLPSRQTFWIQISELEGCEDRFAGSCRIGVGAGEGNRESHLSQTQLHCFGCMPFRVV